MLKSNDNPSVASVSCSDPGPTVTTLDTVSSFASPPIRYSQQTILVRSALERLGLYRRKVIRYQDQRIEDSEGNVESYKRDILWTADEVSAAWTFLGFGMTFTQQHPYGNIFPRLRTYPVGPLNDELLQTLSYGSAQELQEKFSTGALHPFFQSRIGYSLLHTTKCASIYHRPDICRLLLEYGVKPELTSRDDSPLSLALISDFSGPSSANAIDTYRCFLDVDDLVDELKRSDGLRTAYSPFSFTADEVHWLWQKSSELSVGEDLRSNQRVIIRRVWCIIGDTDCRSHHELQFPIVPMDKDILSDIQYGRCRIFEALFSACRKVMESYILGAWFLHWLTGLHLDPELFVASETADLDERSIDFGKRRIVFKRDWEQKWILGFEWVFDHEAPGYTLISEYTTIIVEYRHVREWPFYERDFKSGWGLEVCTALFNRRMAAKEHKERARLGQKQPRSQMPGAWKW
ncbi:hypothetical protein IG631_09760 [Alternaria alternata]|nr:hypothetical protein IG631_09760 [Alternaria alternata]